MDFGFCPLASGSKGNSIFINTGTAKLLLDTGLSGKATIARLNDIGVSIEEIDAILITHEHIDHIQGLKVLGIRKKIPVLCNLGTAKGIVNTLGEGCDFKLFSTGETFSFQNIQIHPFSIQHDTLDPVGFTFTTNNIKLGFCTDLGFVTTLVRNKLENCNHLYIEANHQVGLVHGCNRPYTYKQRVLGRMGHLSNQACADLLNDVYHDDLESVYLAHLSEECNQPDIAEAIVQEALAAKGRDIPIYIAKQNEVSTPILFKKELV